MNWGGPEFVLCIIGMAMLSGVLKSAIRARHGSPDDAYKGMGKRGRKQMLAQQEEEVRRLEAEKRQLLDRLDTSEDRIAVLERIVTDRGYQLSQEIEALREARTLQQ